MTVVGNRLSNSSLNHVRGCLTFISCSKAPGKGMNTSTLPAVGKLLVKLSSFILVTQLVYEEENDDFKPAGLVSHISRSGVFR